MNNYRVLAFYHIVPLANPHEEVLRHKKFIKEKDITSRIYISEQGINAQMCASIEDAQAYISWIRENPVFKNADIKIDEWHEQVFPRQTVKYRKNLVACEQSIDFSKRGEHVPPEAWKEMLESDADYCLIDVRNDYESKIGHFEGAELPPCKDFREFEKYADELNQRHGDEKPPVMMYCTGGIRCELYSSILKEKGYDKVYQLEGGVINYGHKVGGEHWQGKLFVFDDRLTVPVGDEDTPPISQCQFCSKPSDHYYNCANMDCNTLFISCKECVQTHKGCCQETCQEAGHIRPYHQQNPHKPFRRKHYYSQLAAAANQESTEST